MVSVTPIRRRRTTKRRVLIGDDELAAAFDRAQQVQLEIRQWLKSRENKSLVIQYREEEQLRLLRLQVWSQRYSVSVNEILDMILPTLRRQKRFYLRQKAHLGIGVTLPLLTGDWAEQILQEELRDRYPNGEQKEIARELEREHQITVEAAGRRLIAIESTPAADILDYAGPREFMAAYLEQTNAARTRRQRDWNQAWRRRRAYRGSPWR